MAMLIFFARHGYVAVIQDCRGYFTSGGEVNSGTIPCQACLFSR